MLAIRLQPGAWRAPLLIKRRVGPAWTLSRVRPYSEVPTDLGIDSGKLIVKAPEELGQVGIATGLVAAVDVHLQGERRPACCMPHCSALRRGSPAEAAGDDVLVALARLIRALHEASAGWVPPPGAVWGGTPASQGQVAERAELVNHRDYATGNVIFRDGRSAALIDFDLAMPTTGSTTSRTRCGTGRRSNRAIPGTVHPPWRTPISRTGSPCSRTPTA